MVDFKKILEERIKNMSPDEQKKYFSHLEKEKKYDETSMNFEGDYIFRIYENKRKNLLSKPEKVATIVQNHKIPIKIRLEETTNYKNELAIKMVFLGDVGLNSCAYYLDKDFMDELYKDDNCEKWSLCAGTTGSYPEVSILKDCIKQYLNEKLPSLVENFNLPVEDILKEAFEEKSVSFKM
jgi:hypothetical protein